MAVPMDKKLGIAVVLLVGLGGVYYLQTKKKKEELKSYTAESRQAELPKLGIGEEQTKAVNKITISTPPKEGGAGTAVTLEKKGDKWNVTAPVEAAANDTNVKSLLDNLKSLEIKEAIDPGKDSYEKFDVTDKKALHAVFYKGKEAVADMYFGQSGSRGQMTRIAGKDGVYAIKGYSSYLYDRQIKDWRDRTLFKFEEDKVKAITVTNEHGQFAFAKDGDKWSAKFKKAKAPVATKLDKFDEAKVKDAIRAYKGLNADDFAVGKSLANVGLDEPAGTIVFELGDGAKRTLLVGATAEGTSRWAKKADGEEIVSIGSWAADWALGEASKFQKTETPDGGAAPKPPGGPGGGLPPGLKMPPGMPPGH